LITVALFGLAAVLVVSFWLDVPRMGFFAGPAEITPQNKAEDSPGARTTAPAGDSAGSGRADLSALRRKVLASVVTIRSAAGQGTGFIIEQRLVATAYRVVPKGKTATVVFEDGERAEVVEHVACDPIRDVAVLRIDTTRKLKSLELASTLPAAGEPVASFQPGGGELQGEVKIAGNGESSSHVDGREIFLTTLNVVPGWSGSPVVDKEGRVVGIHSVMAGSFFTATRMEIGTGSGVVPVTVLRALLGIAQLDKAISLNPRSPKRYCDRADFYRYRGDLDKALADYTEAIRLKPDYAEAYFNRGRTHAAMGNSGEAIADYTKSIEFGRKSVEAYQCRAAAYENQGHGDKAVADYTEAMRLKPNETELYWLRGLLRAKKGDHDEAVADFTEALRLGVRDQTSVQGGDRRFQPGDPARFQICQGILRSRSCIQGAGKGGPSSGGQ
jgi:hypothetical protein